MGVQSELDFSKVSNPLDSLSDGAKAMLWLVLHIEAISHLHASQAIEKAEKWVEGIDKDSSSLKKAQKNLAQKLKLPNKYDRQAWELPNIFLEELIAGGFLFIKSKRATKTTTTPLVLSEWLQAQKQGIYKTLTADFGMKPLQIFEQDVRGSLSLLDDLVQTTESVVTQNQIEIDNDNASEVFSANKRLHLLRAADASETPHWFMHVPRYFNDALDIRVIERRKNTVPFLSWTQGSLFSFSKDDVLYKNPHSDLSTAPLIQILQASPVDIDSSGQRNKGYVRFRCFFSEKDSTLEMTQDDFVRYLISGVIP